MTLTCLNARHIKNWIHKREGEVRKQAEQIACITAKNAPDLLQILNFTGLLSFVNKLQETCQIYQVATSMLNQACCNLSICGFVGRFGIRTRTSSKGRYLRKLFPKIDLRTLTLTLSSETISEDTYLCWMSECEFRKIC